MGVYDRDWWREHYNKHHGGKKKQHPENAENTRKAFKDVPHNPKSRPPDLPGADWHWTVKLIAFALAMTVFLVAAKHFIPMFKAAPDRTVIKRMN